jgi:hypothetical protein
VMDQHHLDALVAPDGRTGLDDRPRQRRSLLRGQLHRAPPWPATRTSTCPRGRLRPARGDLVLRPRLERAGPAQARLRVRAGDALPPSAPLPADGGSQLPPRTAADDWFQNQTRWQGPSQISGDDRTSWRLRSSSAASGGAPEYRGSKQIVRNISLTRRSSSYYSPPP